MGVNSLPKTATRQRRGCDLNPGPSAPESSTLTSRLPSQNKRCGKCKYCTTLQSSDAKRRRGRTTVTCRWVDISTAPWPSSGVCPDTKWREMTRRRVCRPRIGRRHPRAVSHWQVINELFHCYSDGDDASLQVGYSLTVCPQEIRQSDILAIISVHNHGPLWDERTGKDSAGFVDSNENKWVGS